MLTYTHDVTEYDVTALKAKQNPYDDTIPSHPTNELKYFKRDYDTVNYFTVCTQRLINKIKNYSETPPHITLKQLIRCGYTSCWSNEDQRKFLKNMIALSKPTENPTLYQLLINLKYNPFDGYMGEIKNKSFQQIILDNQEAFIPWFNKWGVTYTTPLKDLEDFKNVFNKVIWVLQFLMCDACERLHWEKNPLYPFVAGGIAYLTNSYDCPEHWLHDYLTFSTSPYDYVVYEFILLKNFHNLTKRYNFEHVTSDEEEEEEENLNE